MSFNGSSERGNGRGNRGTRREGTKSTGFSFSNTSEQVDTAKNLRGRVTEAVAVVEVEALPTITIKGLLLLLP
jgi:hypothetical protein